MSELVATGDVQPRERKEVLSDSARASVRELKALEASILTYDRLPSVTNLLAMAEAYHFSKESMNYHLELLRKWSEL